MSNLSVQNSSQSIAFCGKVPNTKQIIKNMKSNNRVFFRPNMNNKYEKASLRNPLRGTEYLMAQCQNLDDLIALSFKKVISIFSRKAK